MLLDVDPGYAKCGWAITDPANGRPVALGVIVTHAHPDVVRSVKVPGQKKRQRVGTIKQSTDRARRMRVVCRRLRTIVTDWNAAHPDRPITAIAVEQMLDFGAAAAVAANQLPWGAVTMLADLLDVALAEVTARTWQHAVLGTAIEPGKKTPKVNYNALERAMAAFIGRHCAAALEAIDEGVRNHAIDAVGVGMLAALRPGDANWIVERRAEG
jgi:Holliday junction resolvasome RuvABC endonuclease subunit